MKAMPLHSSQPSQVIEGKNLDPQKLVCLLTDLYGQNNFRVEVSLLAMPNMLCLY